MTVALIVPVLNNFFGLAKLFESVDREILPIVVNNWDDNRGVSRGWNIGIRNALNAGCEYAVIVNDDVVLRHGVIDSMLISLKSRTLVAYPSNETGQGHPRGLNFWCFAIRPQEFVDSVGWFDENFSPAYFEDDDMAYRISLSGHRLVNTGTFAYHQVWGSSQGPVKWDAQERYYLEKWGGLPGEEIYTSPFGDVSKTIKDWDAR